MASKVKYLILAILLLIPWRLSAQPIEEYSVNDFSGGWVNSLSNDRMQDNQALRLENFDITDLGRLERRHGYTIHHIDTGVTGRFVALIPYYSGTTKKLFVIRGIDGLYGDFRDSLDLITLYEPELQRCTLVVATGLFPGLRDATIPYNASYTNITGKLAVASTGSELLLYHEDSSWMYPARPLGPGQPKAIGLSGGTMTGTFSYKYCYMDVQDSLSNFSAPSWNVTVNRGKVIITNIGPVADTTDIDSIIIFREDGDDIYHILDTILANDSAIEYIDNTAGPLGAADTADFPWGYTARNRPTSVTAPGAFTVVIDTNTTGGILFEAEGIGMQGKSIQRDITVALGTYHDTMFVAYSIAFIDINGSLSMPSPATWAMVHAVDSFGDTLAWKKQAQLTNIPSPNDPAIVKTIIMRTYSYPIKGHTGLWTAYNREFTPNADDSLLVGLQVGSWVVLDTIPPTDSSSYLDVVPPHDVYLEIDPKVQGRWNQRWSRKSFPRPCEGFQTPESEVGIGSDKVGYNGWIWDTLLTDSSYLWSPGTTKEGYAYGEQPESLCYASELTIPFKPSNIVTHGSRLYAIGDGSNRNRLYFSDFGEPFKWEHDKYLDIQSQSGDWFNGLYSLGNNQLLTLRNNSVYVLQGLTYYQYSFDQSISEVGLSAPRSLTGGRAGIFFQHKSGVYKIGEPQSISLTIQNSIDSLNESARISIGRTVGSEYWLSVAAGSNRTAKTYIFNPFPPHWKSYSFGVTDMVLFDQDTVDQDYEVNKYVFIRDDTLYNWDENATTSLDDTTPIVAIYQSKYFFDEKEDREKIFYIDFSGIGSADSLIITLYDMEGQRTVLIDTIAVDFTINKRHRMKVGAIVTNLSIKITDLGYGDYTLHGYVIGYKEWDFGRKL